MSECFDDPFSLDPDAELLQDRQPYVPDAEELEVLLRFQTVQLLKLEWAANVYDASGSDSYVSNADLADSARICQRRLKAALGERAADAVQAGREAFAEGFRSDHDKKVWRDGTEAERNILVLEARLDYERWALGRSRQREPMPSRRESVSPDE